MPMRLFGTDGIRGIAGEGALSADSVRRLGGVVAAVLREGRPEGSVRACIGRDTRPSGPELAAAFTEGLQAVGVDVLDVGVVPTPAVARLVEAYDAHVGVVISASHNPANYNGLKMISRTGEKLPDALEEEIERRYHDGGALPTTAGAVAGRDLPAEDAVDRYLEMLREGWRGADLSGRRIALDCADGAMSTVAPRLLESMGADVRVTRADADGARINEGAGALHPENLQAFLEAEGAEVGLSFDGDGDRVILVDETGEVRDGDFVLALAARHLQARDALPGGVVVGTVMSNVGLEVSLGEIGARLLRAPVGDRYVLAEMQSGGYTLGGEPSGHTIFLALSKAGDGLLSGLQVLRIMKESGESLSGLSACLQKAPQLIVNVPVEERTPLDQLPGVQGKVREAVEKLGKGGRVLVRYSGTEPLVRVMVEGPDEEEIRTMATAIAGEFEK